MGAWIETGDTYGFCGALVSHPVWVRGLKPDEWWRLTRDGQSHPVWVRGLKLSLKLGAKVEMKSHPVWVRGLKQIEL